MIYSPREAVKVYTSHTFQGACVDSGTEVSDIGTDQAIAYAMGIEIKIMPSTLCFRLINFVFNSDGAMNVHFPVPNGAFI